MKKLVCLIMCLSALLVGCGDEDEITVDDCRFKIVDHDYMETDQTLDGDCEINIYRDTKTNVMYIGYDAGRQFGISPLYDENGNVMIYEEP